MVPTGVESAEPGVRSSVRGGSWPRAAGRWGPLAGAFLGYLGVSLLMHRGVLGQFGTATIGRVSTDPSGFVWWLNELPSTVGRGHNPFTSDFQNHPQGVNAMWNTSVPLLAALLAPVTAVAGPVPAFNVGMLLGPAVSGTAAAAALGVLVRWWPARIVAGGLYAFSPFQTAHLAAGHLNLVWAVLPPILLALAYRLFVERPARPVRLGALTGLALALQTLLYTQTVATGALMLALVGVVLAARFPAEVRSRLPGLLRAGAACAGVYLLVAAYPLFLVLAGPARPRAPIRAADYGVADLANLLVPTWLTAVRPGATVPMRANLGEQGGYLGVAVLLLALAAVLVMTTTARLTVLTGLLAVVASLGPVLHVAAAPTGITLPWRLVSGAPLLGEIEPVRLQVYVTLAVALLVAVALDRAARPAARVARRRADGPGGAVRLPSLWLTRRPLPGCGAGDAPPVVEAACADDGSTPGTGRNRRHGVEVSPDGPVPSRWSRLASGVLAVAAVVSWLPADAQRTTTVGIPTFTALAPARLRGAVVEVWPRPTSDWYGGADALRWQVASGMTYRMTGGYFIGSDPQNDLLLESAWNPYQRGAAGARFGVPMSEAAAAEATRDLRARGVTVVLVVPRPGLDVAPVLDWTRRVTGSEPDPLGDAWTFRLAPP